MYRVPTKENQMWCAYLSKTIGRGLHHSNQSTARSYGKELPVLQGTGVQLRANQNGGLPGPVIPLPESLVEGDGDKSRYERTEDASTTATGAVAIVRIALKAIPFAFLRIVFLLILLGMSKLIFAIQESGPYRGIRVVRAVAQGHPPVTLAIRFVMDAPASLRVIRALDLELFFARLDTVGGLSCLRASALMSAHCQHAEEGDQSMQP